MWQISPPVQKQINLTTSRLVIEPDTLVSGKNYEFKVSLQDSRGFATLQMLTPEGISGSCTVDPSEGMETFTDFTITCDPSKSQLTYTLFQGETQLLSSNNHIFKSKLNANEDERVRIQNSYGQYLLVEIKINVKETAILNSIEEINEIFTSKNASLDLKRMITDDTQSNAIVFISMVASRLNKFEQVDVSDTVTQIIGLMNDLRIKYFDDISPITNVLTKLLLPIHMNHKIGLKCAQILDKISIILQNQCEDVPVSDYVNTTNRILSILHEITDPFETIPPVQNVHSLTSHEYHIEDYEYYGDLDVGIFEKLNNLETITRSVEETINGLAYMAAKLFQPMEVVGDIAANDIQFEVLAFDQEVERNHRNKFQISGTTVVVTLSDKLLAHFDSGESSISCTFFSKSPMWWFSDGNQINSDVVGISIYKRDIGIQENVSLIFFFTLPFPSL